MESTEPLKYGGERRFFRETRKFVLKMFKNRNEAGKKLADKLRKDSNLKLEKTLVVSLPRGGTVVGAVVSALLKIPHRILLTKKISLESDPELALGAVGESKESLLLNQELIRQMRAREEEVKKEVANIQKEIQETKQKYKIPNLPHLKNRQVILVDDGVATGATIKSAIKEISSLGADKIVLALPVAPKKTMEELKKEADEVIVLKQPELFFAVSEFYEDFPQVAWEEVANLLKLTS